ncbi:inorganic polyphosphate kinase, partial [Xanthomonas hyacinthi DSM 19077]
MRLAFVASETDVAQRARTALVKRYGSVEPGDAEIIVSLGGDGFMLRTLHTYRTLGVPFYGMKLGRLGFLMNQHELDALAER